MQHLPQLRDEDEDDDDDTMQQKEQQPNGKKQQKQSKVSRAASRLSLGSSNKVAPEEKGGGEGEVAEAATPASLFASAENPLSSFAAALVLKHRKRSRLNRSLSTARALTPAAAAAALAALVASLCTPDWLRTVERMPNRNRTVLWGPDKSPEYLEKLSHSGLFQLCSTMRELISFCCQLLIMPSTIRKSEDFFVSHLSAIVYTSTSTGRSSNTVNSCYSEEHLWQLLFTIMRHVIGH